ncbi:MAG: hypothetical protein AB7O93_05600 [Vicinamibacterales bacterium]
MYARRVACAAVVAALSWTPAPAWAQEADRVQALQRQIEDLQKDFADKLAALQAEVAALKASQAAAEAAAAAVPVAPPAGAGLTTGKVFNPDVAVIGSFLGAAGRNPVDPAPALEMAESEVSLQAVIDPYARGDFFLSFGHQGVDLEEGFITFTELPGKLLVKAGKMRTAFGKVDGMHSHALPWVDRPLVTTNLLGGEEGLSDAGVSMARLIPAGTLFLEATGQVFRGEAGDGVFQTAERSDLSYLGHLRAYHDLSESTNIDLGASVSRGHNGAGLVDGSDLGRFTTRLYGTDVTLRWRPLQRAIYRQFIGRSEVVWSRREQFGGAQHAMGFYVSGDYQLARRWFAGARFDRSGRADAGDVVDRGGSVLLTYRPSEFSQVRGQYRRIHFGDAGNGNELLFQAQFSIGAHGAHAF